MLPVAPNGSPEVLYRFFSNFGVTFYPNRPSFLYRPYLFFLTFSLGFNVPQEHGVVLDADQEILKVKWCDTVSKRRQTCLSPKHPNLQETTMIEAAIATV
ncbi:unnamed protein product [Onchocerca ochengi]|uniref:RRM domain-containing protein n=1 Tax=Onchocerca ochengi TaxID=42157 RepID=A0A182ETG2_ONCOC|nr:unnamed protein product [Onchocerca ochengi]VDM96060.1 unnamed protein product [Onchocerca ochengi]